MGTIEKAIVLLVVTCLCLGAIGLGYRLGYGTGYGAGQEAGWHTGYDDACIDESIEAQRAQEAYDRGYVDGWDGRPSSPAHAMTFEEARAESGRVDTVRAAEIAINYRPTQPYAADVFDCNDIAAELWAIYAQEGISACVVVGNKDSDKEDFADSNHAWVVVFCLDDFLQCEDILALDPTASFFGIAGNPVLPSLDAMTSEQLARVSIRPGQASEQYVEGYFYDDPDELRQDLRARW